MPGYNGMDDDFEPRGFVGEEGRERARQAGAIATAVLALAARLCAIFMAALTVLLCFSGLSLKLGLVSLVIEVSRALPDLVAGYGVITSPFGGIFRLDFALCAVILFVLDYVLVRISGALR